MNNVLNIFKDLPSSYWLSSTKKTNYPSLDKDINLDIAIIGGGMAGILCAYQLEKEFIFMKILGL